jgi:hypothetical protein
MRALQLLGTFVSGDLSTIFFTVQPRYMNDASPRRQWRAHARLTFVLPPPE